MLCMVILWQSDNLYNIKFYLWCENLFKASKFNCNIKKTVIPNISIPFNYFFHGNLYNILVQIHDEAKEAIVSFIK